MKCEMIRDLLPLYIDGLTSAESNKEIEKHLKSCKECRKYYQEMTGEIQEVVPITEEEIEDAQIMKKMARKKRKTILAGVVGGIVLLLAVIIAALPYFYSEVKYDDLQMSYGVKGNTAYMNIRTKPGYEVYFTGSSNEKEMYFKVLSVRKITSNESELMGWESELGTEEEPCRWTIEFKDKILIIENGKLAEMKEK